MKKVKIFLAIFLPLFLVVGIVFRNSHLLKPFAYGFSAVILLGLGWLFYQIKLKK